MHVYSQQTSGADLSPCPWGRAVLDDITPTHKQEFLLKFDKDSKLRRHRVYETRNIVNRLNI